MSSTIEIRHKGWIVMPCITAAIMSITMATMNAVPTTAAPFANKKKNRIKSIPVPQKQIESRRWEITVCLYHRFIIFSKIIDQLFIHSLLNYQINFCVSEIQILTTIFEVSLMPNLETLAFKEANRCLFPISRLSFCSISMNPRKSGRTCLSESMAVSVKTK